MGLGNSSDACGEISDFLDLICSFGGDSKTMLYLVDGDDDWVQYITKLAMLFINRSNEEGCLVLVAC